MNVDKRPHFFLLILLVSLPLLSTDEPLVMNFVRHSIEEGLTQSTVNCISMDDLGFVWLGTDDGLNHFDGYRFTTYHHKPDDRNSLSGNFVNALFLDTQNRLWVGTSTGLCYYDRTRELFQRFPHDPTNPQSLDRDDIAVILGSKNGELWVGTNGGGLNRFNPQTGISRFYPGSHGSMSYGCNAIIRDAAGALWIGSNNQELLLLDHPGAKLRPAPIQLPRATDQHPPTIRSLLADNQNRIWIGTWRHGLFRMSSDRTTIKVLSSPVANQNSTGFWDIKSIKQDNQGQIWIATLGGGLHRFHEPDQSFTVCQTQAEESASLSSDQIRSLFFDPWDNMWVGTQGGGLCVYIPDRHKFSPRRTVPKALRSTSIAAVYEDSDGSLWVGASTEGLYHWQEKGHRLDQFLHQINRNDSLPHNRVTAIHRGSDKRLWVGTYGGGLAWLDEKNRRFYPFHHHPQQPNSIGSEYIVSLLTDQTGTLWVGTHNGGPFPGGLNRYEPDSETFTRFVHNPNQRNSLSHDGVNTIYQSRNQTLWIGTYHGGLNRWLGQGNEFESFRNFPGKPDSLSHNCVTSLCEDHLGFLWVGTLNGLNRFDPQKGTFKRFMIADGLLNTVIYGILEDGARDIWFSTNVGLSRINPKSLSIRHYDTHDGIHNREFNMGVFYRAGDKGLLFGGIHGLDWFWGETIRDNPILPPVVITDMYLYNERITPLSSPLLRQAISDTDKLTLPHRANQIRFDFVALDFSAPQKNRYAYRLVGLDQEWILRAADQRFASYTNLSPGTYHFQVKATNSNGLWNEAGKDLTLVITPPFWQTLWFRISFFLLFATLSYLIISFLKSHLKLITFWKNRTLIAGYALDHQIASGGMGQVYQAHPLTDRKHTVAIKILREDNQMDATLLHRLENEGRIIDQLNHPNIVTVYERGASGKRVYIVMERLQGITLSQALQAAGRLPVPQVLSIAGQIASALVTIHGNAIIHRDLKPDNIMLCGAHQDQVKLLDFGLAQSIPEGTRLTQSGQIMGTLPYMSPEALNGENLTYASDIYAFGVILYELITGQKPFPAATPLTLFRHIISHAPAPFDTRFGIPAFLKQLILDMLGKKPPQRPTSKELVHRLQGDAH